ncbi:transposase [Singulisphaera acidiphila]|uniref:transposase n=1 Tax=Singulisphaera acidiphila TaxID=466153 RepID=UPI0009DB11D8
MEPFLSSPKPRRFRFPGRKPIDNRKTLIGILFVLKTGIPWKDLPQEMGCGQGNDLLVAAPRLALSGGWRILHEILSPELREADRVD